MGEIRAHIVPKDKARTKILIHQTSTMDDIQQHGFRVNDVTGSVHHAIGESAVVMTPSGVMTYSTSGSSSHAPKSLSSADVPVTSDFSRLTEVPGQSYVANASISLQEIDTRLEVITR